MWRYYFDMSVRETAQRMGLTDSKVKDATHEATSKLGRVLKREGQRVAHGMTTCRRSRPTASAGT